VAVKPKSSFRAAKADASQLLRMGIDPIPLDFKVVGDGGRVYISALTLPVDLLLQQFNHPQRDLLGNVGAEVRVLTHIHPPKLATTLSSWKGGNPG